MQDGLIRLGTKSNSGSCEHENKLSVKIKDKILLMIKLIHLQKMEVSSQFHGPSALPNGKAPRCPLDWRVNGPQSWSGGFRRHNSFILLGIGIIFHGLSSGSPVTVQNELPCKKMGIYRLNVIFHRKSNPCDLHPFFIGVFLISVYQSSLHLILCLRTSTLYNGDTRFVIISQFYFSHR